MKYISLPPAVDEDHGTTPPPPRRVVLPTNNSLSLMPFHSWYAQQASNLPPRTSSPQNIHVNKYDHLFLTEFVYLRSDNHSRKKNEHK